MTSQQQNPTRRERDALTPQERDRLRRDDVYKAGRDWRRGAIPVAELMSRVVDPLFARRGFASSELVAAWGEIAGPAFAHCTTVEKILWQQPTKVAHATNAVDDGVGTLVVRVDGPTAIYLQHEEGQIIQRVNQFFGFVAIDRLKIVQGPILRTEKPRGPELPDLNAHQDAKLRRYIDGFDDDALQEAVINMGRGVLRRVLADRERG